MPSFSVQMDGARDYTLTLHIAQGQQDVVNNRTLVYWSLVAAGTWGSYNNNPTSWSVNIGGVGGSGTLPKTNPNPSQTIAEGSVWLGHNADGTLTFYSSAYWNANHSNIGAGNPGGWTALTTIPRASNVSWAVQNTKYAGTTHQLNTNRASAGFTHTVTWQFGTLSGTVGTGITDSVNWAIPMNLLTMIPNSPTGVGSFTTTTYNGGTVIGTTTAYWTLTVPVDAIPTWTSVSIVDGVADVVSKVGALVQGLSKPKYTIAGAAGIQGSTISQQRFQVENQTVDGATGTVPNPISGSGTVPAIFTIMDTRGQKKTQTNNLTVLPYSAPVVSFFQVERALSTGVVSPDNGTYLKITLTAAVASLINGTQKNTISIRVLSRPRGSTGAWTLRNTLNPAGIVYNSNFLVTGPFAVDAAHEIRIEVVDKFSTSAAQTLIPVASVFMHWGPSGLGVNKYHEQGALDVGGDIYATGKIVPTGFVVTDRLPHTGTTAERDAYFGVPANAAQQSALANRKVVWFNTDFGYEESYYAAQGTAGLTARSLLASVPSGWYPSGRGPFAQLYGGNLGQSSGNAYNAYSAWGANDSWRNVPDTIIDNPSATKHRLVAMIHGYWQVSALISYPNGGGTGISSLRTYTSGGAQIKAHQQVLVLMGSYGQTQNYDLGACYLPAGAFAQFQTDSATWTISVPWLRMEYIAPPLVSL